jgi:polysaccharide pyruvyl transferase WcaK-like protein
MLLVPGTGFLTDAYTGPSGWPYEIFKWSLIARLCRCKLFYVSVGAGPIYHRLSRWLIKSALSLAHFRSYRDDSTRKYLEGIGFPTRNDRVYPDLAFNLPEALLVRGNHRTGQRTVVGVGLMTYAGEMNGGKPSQDVYQEYLQKLSTFVKWLLAHDYDVRLLIGDVVYDKPVKRDFKDLLREHEVLQGGAGGRIIDEPIASVEQLLSQLAATDVVVATRFHNLLLALLLNKPVISLAFHHKCVSLMSDVGLSQYCHDLHHLDVEKLIGQFRDLVKNQEALAPLIQEKAERFRRSLDEQYAIIFQDGFSGMTTRAGTRSSHGDVPRR